MKKQLQIFTACACLALPNLCASNEIENDVEMGISPASSSTYFLSIHEEEKQEEQTQQLPMTIHNDENNLNVNPDQHAEEQEWPQFIKSVCKLTSQYGIQTVSGLTVLGIWYRYFS